MTLCRHLARVRPSRPRRRRDDTRSSTRTNARGAAAHQRRRRPDAAFPATYRARSTRASQVVHAASVAQTAGCAALHARSPEAAGVADGARHAARHLGVVHGAHATGRVPSSVAVTAAHVHHRAGAGAAAATGGRGEAARAEGVEDVKHKGILLRGEVEDPEDIDHSEDEPAGGHGVQRGDTSEYALLHAEDGEDNRYGAEGCDLEAVHGDGVSREGVEDAEDEEELDEDGEP